ncbi:UNVERIFIED_CONTAM: hypothetical protein PYX00_005444 [Menopon gallinae]|uniref:Uncharacterized protein n=1 Tax=Menopon gallinae TaxID=328185 RepID=A0AAW2HRB9_9NEOP
MSQEEFDQYMSGKIVLPNIWDSSLFMLESMHLMNEHFAIMDELQNKHDGIREDCETLDKEMRKFREDVAAEVATVGGERPASAAAAENALFPGRGGSENREPAAADTTGSGLPRGVEEPRRRRSRLRQLRHRHRRRRGRTVEDHAVHRGEGREPPGPVQAEPEHGERFAAGLDRIPVLELASFAAETDADGLLLRRLGHTEHTVQHGRVQHAAKPLERETRRLKYSSVYLFVIERPKITFTS